MRVAVSGGFDPIHPGHILYLEGAYLLGDEQLVVILSRDDQLIMKKGKFIQHYWVRQFNIEWGLKSRCKVVPNIDKDITTCESLRLYKPDIFAKGGDTWNSDNLPEKKICEELGIKIIFGVGGNDKRYASSWKETGVDYPPSNLK